MNVMFNRLKRDYNDIFHMLLNNGLTPEDWEICDIPLWNENERLYGFKSETEMLYVKVQNGQQPYIVSRKSKNNEGVNFMNKLELLNAAISSNEERLNDLESFIRKLSLDIPENKTAALELMIRVNQIEEEQQALIEKKETLNRLASMKVFRMDEENWVCAKSEEQAILYYQKQNGNDISEIKESFIGEVSLYDTVFDGEDKESKISFIEMIETNEIAEPYIIATTEI